MYFGEHLVLCGGNVEQSSTSPNELLHDTMLGKNENEADTKLQTWQLTELDSQMINGSNTL